MPLKPARYHAGRPPKDRVVEPDIDPELVKLEDWPAIKNHFESCNHCSTCPVTEAYAVRVRRDYHHLTTTERRAYLGALSVSGPIANVHSEAPLYWSPPVRGGPARVHICVHGLGLLLGGVGVYAINNNADTWWRGEMFDIPQAAAEKPLDEERISALEWSGGISGADAGCGGRGRGRGRGGRGRGRGGGGGRVDSE